MVAGGRVRRDRAGVGGDGVVSGDPAGYDAGADRTPQPYAYDSSSGTATGLPDETFAMQYQITTYDGGPAVELALPASYADSDLTYPVTVDPTVTELIAGDGDTTYITYGDDADYSSSDYLLIGSDNSGTNYSDSLLKFPSVPTDNGDDITAATLNLWDVYAGYCTGTTAFTVMPVTSSWTASGKKSWSNMPGTAAEIGKWGPADAPSAACSNTSKNLADGGALSVSLSTTYLQEIALGQYTDDGFAIAAGSDTLDDSYKEFASDNYAAHSPSLSVTYTPDQAPDIEHTWPTAGYQTSALTPELEVQAVDPDAWPNASLSYDFSVYTSSGTLIASSGSIAATDWQVPAGDLDWNGTYQWDVSAYDGFDTTTSGLAPLETVTAQPLVSSSLAQNGGVGYSPDTGNYTTSATDAQEKVAGPQLAVVRSYNSLDGRASDSFGQGWSSVADMRAVEDQDGSNDVVITDAAGQQSRYGYETGPSGQIEYIPPLGTYATLTAVPGGGYELIDKQDTTYLFTQADGAGTWLISSITTKAGLAQTFGYGTEGSQTALQTITDQASGRTLTFTWAKPAGAAYYHVATVSTDDASAGDASTASPWTYLYTGDELAAVCPPDETASDSAAASCTQYTYQTGTDYPAAVLDAGPYSYWRLDEPSGSTGAASSVLSNEGSDDGLYSGSGVTLGSSSDPGPLDGGSTDAAGLSGSSSYVQLPGNLVASSSYQSVALWFKTTSTGVLFSYSDAALSAGTVNNNYTPSLYIGTDGKLNGEFWYSGGCTPITSTAAVNDGKWHFVVLTSAGATQSLYLDGVLQGSLSGAVAPIPDGTEHEYIGAGFWSEHWPDTPDPRGFTGVADSLDGQVAEAAFFTSPLPATQITQLYDDAQQGSAWMTKDVTAAGSTAAQVAYNAADGRVSSVTDQDGGTWTLGQPATSGTAAPFASALLGNAPDGYWRLGDQAGSSLAADEVAGGTGSYNDVTLGGSGPFGSSGPASASFGGVDSTVDMPSGEFDNSTTSATAETIGLWFKTTQTGQVLASLNDTAVVAGGNIGEDYTPLLYIGSDGKLISGPSIYAYVESSTAVDDGKWHFAVLVLNSGTSPASDALYLDGVRVGQTSGTVGGGGTLNDSEVGAGYLGGGWPDEPDSGDSATASFFNGSIAEVFHVPAAISGVDVTALYSAAQASVGQAATETVAVTDPGGNTLTYRYDLQNGGRILSETDGTGATTTYGYDTGGFLDTVTNPDGDVVTTTHDARGNALSKTTCQDLAAGDCSTSYYTYYLDASSPTDPRNDEMLTSSDGRSASSTDTTYQTTYTYDSLGDELTETSPPVPGYPDGMTTTNTYTTTTTGAWGGGYTPACSRQRPTRTARPPPTTTPPAATSRRRPHRSARRRSTTTTAWATSFTRRSSTAPLTRARPRPAARCTGRARTSAPTAAARALAPR